MVFGSMTSLSRLLHYSSIDTAEEAWAFINKKFTPWQDSRPSDYGGVQWDGYIPFIFDTGQSHSIDKHNYKTVKLHLKEWFESKCEINETTLERDVMHLEEAENGHWACGYVNYLLLSQNAPDSLVILVAQMLDCIDDNCILDSDGYSEWEYANIEKLWHDLTDADKLSLLKKSKFSDEEALEFKGKQLNEIVDENGYLYDYLREWLN